jgi:hypothetical protein
MQAAAGMEQAHGAERTLHERSLMIKVRTFMTPIKIFATSRELQDLDVQVTTFLSDEKAGTVFSVSDATTAGENGETIGLIRTVAYRVAEA